MRKRARSQACLNCPPSQHRRTKNAKRLTLDANDFRPALAGCSRREEPHDHDARCRNVHCDDGRQESDPLRCRIGGQIAFRGPYRTRRCHDRSLECRCCRGTSWTWNGVPRDELAVRQGGPDWRDNNRERQGRVGTINRSVSWRLLSAMKTVNPVSWGLQQPTPCPCFSERPATRATGHSEDLPSHRTPL